VFKPCSLHMHRNLKQEEVRWCVGMLRTRRKEGDKNSNMKCNFKLNGRTWRGGGRADMTVAFPFFVNENLVTKELASLGKGHTTANGISRCIFNLP
jgi:hypothetical protein